MLFLKLQDEVKGKYTLVSYVGQSIPANVELVDEFEPVGEITIGQYFPPLKKDESLKDKFVFKEEEYQRQLELDRMILASPGSDLSKLPNAGFGYDPYPSQFSFVAIDSVDIFSIPRKDLIEYGHIDILNRMENMRHIFPSHEALFLTQEKYLAIHGWRGNVDRDRVSERILREYQRNGMNYINYKKMGAKRLLHK